MNDEAFVDEDMEPDPRLNEITNKIIGCAIEVHRHLGPRYLEAYYKEAMAIEMNLRGVRFQRQKDFEVLYKGHVIGTGRLDFLVEDEVIVELKAVESLTPAFTAQVISYLKANQKRLAIIINFNVKLLNEGIKRVAN